MYYSAVKPSYDLNKYLKLLKPVASLSYLFSDNEIPYINSKFVERLYVIAAGAQDTASDNSSFDAIAPIKVGVGIKTFVSSKSSKSKTEKIAEFTKDANAGMFEGGDNEQLLRKAIELRNIRLKSDAISYGLDMSKAIYHCLIRIEGGAIIQEEPMTLVKVDKLYPVDGQGRELTKIGEKVILSDGINTYSYNKSNRVLYKKFNVNMPPEAEYGSLINLDINWNILNELGEGFFGKTPISESEFCLKDNPQSSLLYSDDEVDESQITQKPENFIVLPLYSTKKGIKEVQPKSGINQWNAEGKKRKRKFGEAYIPIPSWIHRFYPRFLPPKDKHFLLKLQDGTIHKAKICQEGDKALMTDPNDKLCEWFYSAIEPNLPYDKIMNRLPEKRPYTYDDLVRVGKDSVKVTKAAPGLDYDFSLTFCPLGTFDDFMEVVMTKDQ